MIKYTKSNIAKRETFRTERFDNIFQGEVYEQVDSGWSGWFYNWARNEESKFRFDFKSRTGAVRWVNRMLREVGIDKP